MQMDLTHLTRPPFNLKREDIAWVAATLSAMTVADRAAQLFVHISMGQDPDEPARIARLRPAGITRFYGPDLAAEAAFIDRLRGDAAIPLLVSADLEGSRMSLPFGTPLPNPLALAAVDDVAASRTIARIMADEARAIGINWSFTPVLDINAAFRSPIVATRGLGSDPDRIAAHALAQIAEFQAAGIAATAKHWPGEGHDDRDQHLVTTVNPLTLAEWEATHGRLYRAAIDAGVMAVMSAHIAFPAFVRSIDPDAGPDAFRPASVSRLLNIDLLRGRLGFNGLIVSDATPMAGLTGYMRAEDGKIAVIAEGCDIILFSDDPEGDLDRVTAACADGRISPERLADAVARTLGLKAALGLHRAPFTPASGQAATFGTAANRAVARAVTARAPTLVKDRQGLMPLDPDRHRRVLVVSGGIVSPLHREPMSFALPDMLRAEGFAVTVNDPANPADPRDFDLMLYVLGEETLLTRGRIFLDWARLTGHFGAAMRRHWHDVPTALVSFGYPYYLYDAPQMPCVINAYATMDDMQAAVIDCMLGRAPFAGSSPVDAFCGQEAARY
jgi:beta-N-acetylhexosaminidase